jgi:hypothetical protein
VGGCPEAGWARSSLSLKAIGEYMGVRFLYTVYHCVCWEFSIIESVKGKYGKVPPVQLLLIS